MTREEKLAKALDLLSRLTAEQVEQVMAAMAATTEE
jgi:hypothetical protein